MKFLSFALHLGLGSALVLLFNESLWDPNSGGVSLTKPRGGHGRGRGRDLGQGSPINIDLKAWKPSGHELQWYGPITVGTPPQTFNLLFDTGAPFMLLPRDNCTNCGEQHAHYAPSESSTFENQPGTFLQVLFGSSPDDEQQGANCTIVSDTVRMAGRAALEQEFLACHTYSSGLREHTPDGIFGLGSTLENQWGPGGSTYKSAYWQLVENGALSSPEFGFLFRGNGPHRTRDGVLTIGGTDEGLYEPQTLAKIALDWPLSESRNRWVVPVDGVRTAGGALLPNTTNSVALVDTGTTGVVVPDYETAEELYKAISPQITRLDDSRGIWGAPCDVLDQAAKDVWITLGSGNAKKDVVVKREFLNGGPMEGMLGLCWAAFIDPVWPAREPDQGRPAWVLGNVLLRSYYTVWNAQDRTLGWALPKL